MRGRPRSQPLMVDDMVSFMGEVYAVDRGGRVFAISYDGLTVRNVVDEVPESLVGAGNRKKWLVVSSGCLYMVRRCAGAEVKFEVYELDLELRCWNLMESLGDDRILVVSFDGCFFLSVGVDLPPRGFRGNLIIFYRGCFYSSGQGSIDEYKPDSNIFGYPRSNIYEYRRRKNRTGDECDVAVYDYMMPDTRSNCSPVMCWSKYDNLLWPPPRWLAPDASSSSGSSEEDEEYESDSRSEHSQLNHEDSESDSHNEHSPINHEASRKSNSYAETEDEEQRAENHPTSTQEQSHRDEECVHQEATYGQPEKQNDAPDTPEASTTVTETFRTYKGLNIKADVVPTLQKIWAKHGNITEESAVHNGDILARALESLARVVETLQSSSGWSLEDGQAEYMSSTLLDLKHMQINVDWLAPSVEKALALNRSKPSIKTLVEIDKAKADAQELRMKLLDELAKVEEKEKLLEEERGRVSRTISVSGEIDMDGCLGDGLC